MRFDKGELLIGAARAKAENKRLRKKNAVLRAENKQLRDSITKVVADILDHFSRKEMAVGETLIGSWLETLEAALEEKP